jgi:hypothetical protein
MLDNLYFSLQRPTLCGCDLATHKPTLPDAKPNAAVFVAESQQQQEILSSVRSLSSTDNEPLSKEPEK